MPAPANQSAPAKKVRSDIIPPNSVFPGFLPLQQSNNQAVGLFLFNQGATDKKPAAGNAAKPTSRKKVCSAFTNNVSSSFFWEMMSLFVSLLFSPHPCLRMKKKVQMRPTH